MIGAVIGSPYEVKSTKDKSFPLITIFSNITDDTVMTCAAALTLLNRGHNAESDDFADSFRKLGNKYPGAGYGGNFRRWLKKPDAPAYNSWGNGSAMRVSPVGWIVEDEKTVLKLAEASAACTHNHPDGIKGAQASALAVFMARKGKSKEEIRGRLTELFGYDLNRKTADIRQNYTFQVSCMESVPEAIIAFLDSDSFEDALRNAVSLGGDSDTQAAICCSIAEAFYGEIPQKILAMVLPRIPYDLLSIVHSFSQRYLPESSVKAVRNEMKFRSGNNMDGIFEQSSRYSILLYSKTQKNLQDYMDSLKDGTANPGRWLQHQLDGFQVAKEKWEFMLQCLLNSKQPRIYAESELRGDGSDWSNEELKILGGISVAVPVSVFDDGRHYAPEIHTEPFDACLIYTPGILLRNDTGNPPVDWDIISDGSINQDLFTELYETKLLPAFKYASAASLKNNKKAIVTVPGIGCGQFADRFKNNAPYYLKTALETILEKHCESLTGIALVYYDPYSECSDDEKVFGSLTMRTRPLRITPRPLSQLCRPQAYAENADDYSAHDLYSIVAWDHVSWPGNDFYTGNRATDDGVKAAATDSMFRITGIRGFYDSDTNRYLPPEGYKNWESAVLKNRLEIRALRNVILTGNDTIWK